MMKLLKANLARLFANGIFRIAVVGSAFVGVLCVIWERNYIIATKDAYEMAEMSVRDSIFGLDAHFLSFVHVIAVAVAAFCSFYISSDYKNGTLRNKVVAGNTRAEIYLSNLAANIVAACMMFTAYLVLVLCMGLPLIGAFQQFAPVKIIAWILSVYTVMITFAAVITCIAMLIARQVIAIGISVCTVFVGLCIGQAFLSRLTDVDLYLQGRERMLELVLFLSDFLPGSQLMEFRALKYSVGNLNPIVIVSGSVVFTVLLTVIGLIRFRRKELQ